MTAPSLQQDTAPGAPPRYGARTRLMLMLRFSGRARGKMMTSVVLASAATILQLAPYYLLYLAIDALVHGTATWGGLLGLALLTAVAVAGRPK